MCEAGINFDNFDSDFYVATYPDLEIACRDKSYEHRHRFLVEHFLNHGRHEGRQYRLKYGADGYCGDLGIKEKITSFRRGCEDDNGGHRDKRKKHGKKGKKCEKEFEFSYREPCKDYALGAGCAPLGCPPCGNVLGRPFDASRGIANDCYTTGECRLDKAIDRAVAGACVPCPRRNTQLGRLEAKARTSAPFVGDPDYRYGMIPSVPAVLPNGRTTGRIGTGVYCGGLTIPPYKQFQQIRAGRVGDPDYRDERIPYECPALPCGAANYNGCKFYPFKITPREQKQVLKSTFIGDPDYRSERIPYLRPVLNPCAQANLPFVTNPVGCNQGVCFPNNFGPKVVEKEKIEFSFDEKKHKYEDVLTIKEEDKIECKKGKKDKKCKKDKFECIEVVGEHKKKRHH